MQLQKLNIVKKSNHTQRHISILTQITSPDFYELKTRIKIKSLHFRLIPEIRVDDQSYSTFENKGHLNQHCVTLPQGDGDMIYKVP